MIRSSSTIVILVLVACGTAEPSKPQAHTPARVALEPESRVSGPKVAGTQASPDTNAIESSTAGEKTKATGDEASSAMIEGLIEALESTPYAAEVVHTGVEVRPVLDEAGRVSTAWEEHVFSARVVQTHRGPQLRSLSYVLSAEVGEEAGFDSEPVVITLCGSPGQFVWPGVGAQFPANDATRQAIAAMKPIPESSEFRGCE